MAKISPFAAFRYNERAISLSHALCPPRDAVSPQEERALRRHPANAIHVDMPLGSGKERSLDAEVVWKRWLRRGDVVQDAAPAFYVCEESFHWRGKIVRRLGFFAALSAQVSAAADILAHERTFSKPANERLSLLRTLRADVSPIFGLFQDLDGRARRILSRARRGKPVARARLQPVNYRLWRIADTASIAHLSAVMAPQKILIADGHHRWEAAKRYWGALRSGVNAPAERGILAYLCPEDDEGLVVLPTHRVIDGRSWREASRSLCRLTRLASLKELSERLSAAKNPYAYGFFDGGFFLAVPNSASGCKSGLGVEWLNRFALARVRPQHIRYTPDARQAVSWARQERGTAFVLKPFAAKRIREAVAKAGLLPQKSTYFYPKVPAGLVFKAAV